MSKLSNFLNAASQVSKDVSSMAESYEARCKAKESGKLSQWKQDIEKYERKSMRVIISCLLIWGIMILITIVLCFTGNDIVLKMLHI